MELTFDDLMGMEGESVLVKDLEYEYPDQVCTVRIQEYADWHTGDYLGAAPVCKNEEYSFDFEVDGRCADGEFTVYKI